MPGEEHENRMTEREVMPRLPTSGQIIGSLVTRLGISLPMHLQRNARRHFAADAHVAAGQYDLAVVDCNTALKLSPKDAMAYFTRGNAHLFSVELELALADFSTAVELDPASSDSIYGRGLVRLLLGDEDGAERDFQRARELGYDHPGSPC